MEQMVEKPDAKDNKYRQIGMYVFIYFDCSLPCYRWVRMELTSAVDRKHELV